MSYLLLSEEPMTASVAGKSLVNIQIEIQPGQTYSQDDLDLSIYGYMYVQFTINVYDSLLLKGKLH